MQKKILVIDDDPVLCEIIADQLIDQFFITTLNDGTEALNYIRSESFDLYISDILLPGLDGIELTQEILSQNPDAIIIVISSGGCIDSSKYLNLAQSFGASYTFDKHSPICELTELIKTIL
ncbi:MAG: response regulator [Lentisphaeria bacterium]